MVGLSDEYVAGLFDGEGTVGIYTNGSPGNLACQVAIQLCYLPVLEEIAEQYGGYIYSRDKRRTPKHRLSHQWCSRKRSVVSEFLNSIQPHVHEKRAQVDLALLWLEGAVGNEAADMLKELKHIEFADL